jgi:hypothetical protein
MSSVLAMATELILALLRTGQLSPAAVVPVLQETHAHLLALKAHEAGRRTSPLPRGAAVPAVPSWQASMTPLSITCGMWGVLAMAQRAPSAQAWLGRAGVSAQVRHPAHPALSRPSGDRAPPTAHPATAPLGAGAHLSQGPSAPRGDPGAPNHTPAPAASPTHAVTTACARNTRTQEDKAVLKVQYVQRLLWFPDVSI